MSELINNSRYRKDRLKELILQLHKGDSAELVRQELIASLQKIPYGEVVEVEQELMQEGLPQEEVLKLCDIHGSVLQGHVDLSAAQEIPEGHPVDVFLQENLQIRKSTGQIAALLESIGKPGIVYAKVLNALKMLMNELMDIDKHYQRKEYLVFPYLEKNEITGPPMVMWGKHDEIRAQLKGALELLNHADAGPQDIIEAMDFLFLPLLQAINDMTQKEEEILFPMCMDVITVEEWWSIQRQTLEYGFTLYDPPVNWKPEGIDETKEEQVLTGDGNIQLPSGSFSAAEIMAILNTLPVDMTFVDKNDRVKYFTQGKERIFARSRSIINRDVRLCHPPGSTHIVEKILEDFKSGRASHAPFWIQMKGMFIKIEYFALRDENGQYLGTLEVSQDLTHNRSLEGERRILDYSDAKE